MVNGFRLRMFKDRIPIGNLIKKSIGRECSRSGIQPFYCKKYNGDNK